MTHDCSGTRSWTTPPSTPRFATRTVRAVTSPLDKLGMFKDGEIAPAG
jgi:hypothetical protein